MAATTARPRVLVVDHRDSYTWNLVHLVAAVTGELPDVVQHDERPTLTGYSHIVLSPGPGHPANPADFALQDRVFGLGVPVLGVCLGMQALVSSFGGTVDRITPAHGEVAVVRHDGTGVLAGLPDGFAAVRYHSLAALELPDDLVAHAWCDGADAGNGAAAQQVVMAVRHRELPLHGVQFHPESVLSEHGRQIVATFLEVADA